MISWIAVIKQWNKIIEHQGMRYNFNSRFDKQNVVAYNNYSIYVCPTHTNVSKNKYHLIYTVIINNITSNFKRLHTVILKCRFTLIPDTNKIQDQISSHNNNNQ